MNIATHNSGTGEKSGGWLSRLFFIFAKCQSKTLVEQYNAGVRLFDLRIRKNKKQHSSSRAGREGFVYRG